MEPGIPDPNSKATQLGIYNLDPAVRFGPHRLIHGVLRPTVVHPAVLTFKLPDSVSFAERATGAVGRAACRHQGADQAGRRGRGHRRGAHRHGDGARYRRLQPRPSSATCSSPSWTWLCRSAPSRR
ncbi:MAG: hypothetical protein R2851_03315 [Caldilineaceae bacterium]